MRVVAAAVVVSASLCSVGLAQNRPSEPSAFESYSGLPTTLDGRTIRWKNDVHVTVTLPPIDKVGNFDDLGQLRDMASLQMAALASTLYAKELASAAGLQYLGEGDGQSSISVNVVDQLQPVSRVSQSATTHVVGIVKQDSVGQDLCSLRLTWLGRFIQFAWIEIKSSAPESDGKRCVSELIWRSFGFLGTSEIADPWVDDVLPESDKVELVKRLYAEDF
jgi:hypothetical protein